MQSASCCILTEISGCVSLHAVVQYVAVCTNVDFMTRWLLASLKLAIDDVISTEMESYM